MSRPFEPIVLCYHAVSQTWEHPLSVPPEALERHLRRLLERRYLPASAERVVAGRERVLHVTFDDAYTSVRAALPILEQLGVPATIFACAGLADTGAPLDIPELVAEVRRAPVELATMAWDELRELAARGIEIGSHTVSHPHLTMLGDDELIRELTESKERIEAALGRPCRFLAYPYGDEDERVLAAAERAGYDGAFALPGNEDRWTPFAVPRVGIYRGDRGLNLTLKTTAPARRSAARVLRAARRRR